MELESHDAHEVAVQQTDTSSYRSIFKATSLFGGVQVYQILIGIIKSKFIAVLLGPEGIGLMGLYTSATEFVKQITSLGLSQSAVRDVSEANGTGDYARISRIIAVLKKLVWITGVLGTVTVVVLSPLLSKTTFGNYDYTIPLIVLSITLLIDQLCAGQKVVLQGMRKLKDLAKATAIGSTFGLIVSVPLYYFLGIKGIVPTIILNSITSFLLSYLYSKKVTVEKIKVSKKQTFQESKIMLKMGVAMSVSSILTVASAYVLRSFIRAEGGIEYVGIFTAGYAIINTYVNMVFTAMSTDFYPRLSAVNKNNEKCKEIVNQQGEIGTLIMAPMLMVCIAFMPIIIELLYSSKFSEANDYVLFTAVGMMFRFASVLIAHLFLAKGSARIYIRNEIAVCVYTLIMNLVGFHVMGLKGLGVSFMLSYFIYLAQVLWQTSKYYNFSFTHSFIRVYSLNLALVIVCLLVFLLIPNPIKFYIGVPLCATSLVLAIKGLDERMNIMDFIRSKNGTK